MLTIFRQRLPAHPLQRGLQLGLLWVLLLALLAGPMLAHWHAVLHAGVNGEHSTNHAHAQHSGDHGHHQHDADQGYDASALSALFAGHGKPSDCRLFDQACGGDAVAPLTLVALPALPSTRLLRISLGLFIARWATAFDARGPPVFV
ncbi:MAG: hypothetical protein ACKVIH_08640 [Burkholderiales bacterium]